MIPRSKYFFPIVAIISILCCVVLPASATIVGVRWNASNSSPSAITYIDINGNTIEKPNFDMTLPWSGMRRINISTTQYQTMVTVPKFWYNGTKYTIGINTYYEWWVSDTNTTALKVHPAFISNGVELPSFLVGAFEGSVYNVTTASYNTGDFAGVNTSIGGDLLSSVAGNKPASGLNSTIILPYFRNLAHNRGTGWELQNFNQISAIQLLYIIEYANLNSQSTIGVGVTQITDDATTNMAVNTGYTAGVGVNASQLGNTSGQAVITHYKTGQTTYPNSYRGIENFWGNIYKWVDGINIKADWNPWIADHDFASDTFTHPYVDTGLTLANTNNYGVSIASSVTTDYAFLPLTVGGASNQYLCDYYYQATGNRAALQGGRWHSGTLAGVFGWSLDSAAASVYRTAGARMSYIPNGTALSDQNWTFSPANATFTQNITSGQNRVSVLFTDGSTGKAPLTYSWYFTDVSGNNTQILFSNAISPEQMFGWGNYSINLTLVNAYSFDYAYGWVNVSHLISNITTNVSSGVKPLTVMFNDTSYGGTAISRLWEFGDGSTSISQDVVYTYAYAGNYTVNLTVSDLYGSSKSQKNITVINTSVPIYADFSASNTAPAILESVAFSDLSTGSPTTWNWSFGDGTNSTLQNPSHAYSSTGLKTVFLTVQNVTGSSNTTTKVNYINVTTNGTASINTQDIVMAAAYNLVITVTATDTGLPIPGVTITDQSNQTVLTDGVGIGTLTEPYSTVTGTLVAAGYVSRAFSIVVDNDTWVTYQMEATSGVNNYAVTYPPKDVRFHTQTLAGSNIQNVRITAEPYTTTLGNYQYVANLFGYDIVKTPLPNLTLSGYTDTRGDITFAMMSDYQYAMSFTKTGYTFDNITITPHDDNYLIYPVTTGSLFVVNGTSPSAQVTYIMRSTRVNTTTAVINVSYVDLAGATTSGTVNLFRYGNNNTADSGVNLTLSFTGNATWQNFTIIDQTVAGCSASTSAIINKSGSVIACYNQTNVEDKSYMAVTTGYTSSGTVYETGTTWFRRTVSPIAGLSPEFALFIALFIMMFTALMAGTSTAPAVSLVVTFEGWVMWGLNMFVIIDPVPLYVDPASGSTTVPIVLTIMTFITILWLFTDYRRKGK